MAGAALDTAVDADRDHRPATRRPATASESADRSGEVLDALRTVYDPCCEERGISIVDMGLIDAVSVQDGQARVTLVLTSGWCPFSVRMLNEAEQAIRRLPGLGEVTVDVSWDRPWDTSRMSEQARNTMRLLPEPVDVVDRTAFVAQIRAARPSPTGPTAQEVTPA